MQCCCQNTLHQICCTKSVWVRSAMTMFAKVQKPSLVMTIPICLCVQQGKGGKLLSMCEFHSLTWYLQQYLEMYHRLQCAHSHTARPHWHREKCATVGCDILRQICNAARKWPWGQMKWRGAMTSWSTPSFRLSSTHFLIMLPGTLKKLEHQHPSIIINKIYEIAENVQWHMNV